MRNLTVGELGSLVLKFPAGWRTLCRTPFLSPDAMRNWQFARIQRLVAHAYAHVPFYRARYQAVSFTPRDLRTWDDFHRLPVVCKDDVIANYPERMLDSRCRRDALIVSRSSGSSGKVLDVAYDSAAMLVFVMAGLRLYRMGFAYWPWHRQVYIYTSPYPLNSLCGLYPMTFISTLAPVADVVAQLVALQPALLVCYPSHLAEIAAASTPAQRAAMRLRCISVNSEMSTQAERDRLSALFGCAVLDEYSSEELTRIAAQCCHHTYHLFEDINYIETLDDRDRPTSGVGTIAGTNLHNTAMPMIRYKQDDRGRLAAAPCACGWQFRHLTEFQGRRNDAFVLPSGKVLSSGFLLDATYEFLLAYRSAVRDFCLVQTARDRIVLQVVPGTGWNGEVRGMIAARFTGFLEAGVTFDVEAVDACIKTTSGKRNPIINLTTRHT